MKKPMMSGFCAFPSTDGSDSHERCARIGAGNWSNPTKEFAPCPCSCHLGEEYECAGCGRTIREAPMWPNYDPTDVDEDGRPGMIYVHVDTTGRAIGEEC